MMEYKGYIAKVEYAPEDKVFHGCIVNILDTVTFEGTSVKQLEREFHKSVDEYVAFCHERGREPERPYSGKFNIRISPELHRALSIAAKAKRKSMNALIEEMLREKLELAV